MWQSLRDPFIFEKAVMLHTYPTQKLSCYNMYIFRTAYVNRRWLWCTPVSLASTCSLSPQYSHVSLYRIQSHKRFLEVSILRYWRSQYQDVNSTELAESSSICKWERWIYHYLMETVQLVQPADGIKATLWPKAFTLNSLVSNLWIKINGCM